MTLHDAMLEACAAVRIEPPRQTKPGQWVRTRVDGKAPSNRSGAVLVFDDERGGVAYNWATGEQRRFTVQGTGEAGPARPRPQDQERARQRAADTALAIATCDRIVRACRQEAHPYLERKGFPDELGLVIDDPREHMPGCDFGRRMQMAVGDAEGPFLVIPGRIGGSVTTVQFIAPDGTKLHLKGSLGGGSAHRIAVGRETWVAEGIATALSVRAALRLLGRSATVLSAFAANNSAKVAGALKGSIIAADNDKPIPQFDGLGTGEYWARKSGCRWVMPPALGDFNDMHTGEGLRAVALCLRELPP